MPDLDDLDPLPLPAAARPVADPPEEPPLLHDDAGDRHPDSDLWYVPRLEAEHRSATLAEYRWLELPVVAGRFSFGLTAELPPTSLTVSFHRTRRSARANLRPHATFEVMNGDGQAEVFTSPRGLRVRLGTARTTAPFVRIHLEYRLAHRDGNPEHERCWAVYHLRLRRQR